MTLTAERAWAPYCLVCSTMGRMTPTATGWKCEGKGDHFGRAGCGNEIGFDLHRLQSPVDTSTPLAGIAGRQAPSAITKLSRAADGVKYSGVE